MPTMDQARQDELREEHRLLLKGSYRKGAANTVRVTRRDEIDALFLAEGLTPPSLEEELGDSNSLD